LPVTLPWNVHFAMVYTKVLEVLETGRSAFIP
jgi:hypothetical protein